MSASCRLSVSYSTWATAIVIPRSRSSGALSIEPYSRTAIVLFFVCSTFVIAAVRVVLPWSMCPIVPTFTCGFVRSYLALAMLWLPPTLPGFSAGSGAGGRLAGDLGHDFFGDRGRDLFVAGELHRVGRPALRHRPHLGGVAEHRGQGHVGADHLGGAARFHGHDAAATAVEVADDGAHVLLGRDHLDVHDGLQQDGLGLAAGFLEAHGAGDLEGHLVGVHLVVGAVRQVDLDVHHRVAGQHAGLHRFLDALLHGRHVLARHGAADDLVLEHEAAARLVGLDLDVDVAVLAAAARLAHVLALGLALAADGLAEGHLRLADVGLHAELAQQPVDDDHEMQLAHAVDQRLRGLF